MFADIVGDTAMMQTYERKDSTLFDKFLKTINDQVERHNGRVVNNYGDSCVCTFDSAVYAIYCAKESQSIFISEPIVLVRLGLHSGDFFYKEGNVFGDSVNLTSRIESMGIVGSILISKRLRDVVKNQSNQILNSLILFEFKNVEEPIEVFTLANEGIVVPKEKDLKSKFKEKKPVRISNQLVGFIGIVLTSIIGIIFWQQSQSSNKEMLITADSLLESPNTPLP